MQRHWLNPTSLIWLFSHLILALLGLVFVILGASAQLGPIQTILYGAGGSLFATGLAGEVLFLYVRSSDTTRSQLEIIQTAGLKQVFPVRSVQIKERYDERLKHAREIDIMGFGMSSLREDFGPDFVTWSRKSTVRILLIDPSFPTPDLSYSNQRDKEERQRPGKIGADVEAFLSYLDDLHDLDPDRFKVRLLRCLPSINLFRVNDELFWGPYLVLTQSRNTPTFLVGSGFLLDTLRSHFSSLWGDDFSVPAFPRP